jgi:cytochrome c biogenesis protein CcmG, thiol:disulfide interchange protein DsbE
VIRLRAAALCGLVTATVLSGCTSGGDAPDPAPGTDVGAAETSLRPCPEQPDQPAAGEQTLPPLAFDCLGGGRLDLARAPGVPTLVNLWGSWCAPCREELPLFQELADSAGEQVRVLGVISKDGEPQAESFAADAGVTFPSAFDGEGKLMAGLGINVLPHTYFLDADGGLVHTQVGPVTSVDELRGLVAEHLGVQL